MSKETNIIFVYDTELLQKEEDDPNSAILYFYPTWVSDQQKTALCGQLMGTVLCLQSILAMPKTVSLQTGKFFLIKNERYILVVGTDRNILDWVLEHRANLIYSLVNFFHKDFVSLAQLYKNENLNAKLYHIFDTYLKLLFLGGCVFSHMPLLDLSKIKNDVLTDARLFLDNCKTIPNILGGTLLFHNKVVHTQLSSQITKKIAFSDPFRIKNPAELSNLNFEVPPRVKLLQVFISGDEYENLFKDSIKDINYFSHQAHTETEQSRPNCFQDPNSPSSFSLKRDNSLLFTSVPEDATFSPCKVQKNIQNKKSRPNSLSLKSCSLDSSGAIHLGRQSSPVTPYWSQSSAVSTPMTETKTFVDQPDVQKNNDHVWKISMGFHKLNIGQDPNIFKYPKPKKDCTKSNDCAETSKYYQTICFPCPLEVYSRRLEKAERMSTFVQNSLEKNSMHHISSLRDLSETNSISNPLNQYSNFRNKICLQAKRSINLRRWKSIHDPLFPWCKGETIAASQYYVEDILDEDFFVGRNKREECSFREIITERKRSLTLPIKPHNASEAQKTDMKSPGYCTPLMNKLAIASSIEKQQSKEIPIAPFISKDKKQKTDENCELKKCILFMYGEQDMVLAMLITKECSAAKNIIEQLQQVCSQQLPALEKQLKSSIEPFTNATSSESDPYSMLSVDGDWDTLKRMGPWEGSNFNDLTRLHGDFGEHKDITEIYLRKPESVLFGHHGGPTEVFYYETASLNNGLLPPNDALGSVHQTAKKRLEKNHDVFIK